MTKQQKKDFLIVGTGVVFFFGLLIAGRQAPQTNFVIGAKWCDSKNQIIDKVLQGQTKRPPYHSGEFKPQTKLTIICKKKDLH